MRILVVGRSWPSITGKFARGDFALIHQLVVGLARAARTTVGYLHMILDDEAARMGSASDLAGCGIDVLDPLDLRGNDRPPTRRLASLFSPRLEDFYRIDGKREPAFAAVQKWKPDVLVVPLCELLTALFANCPVAVKYAYYGNPDPKNYAAQLMLEEKGGIRGVRQRLRRAMRQWKLPRFEKLHLDVMRRYDLVGEVSFNDMLYYREHGINVRYVRHIWTDPQGELACAAKQAAESRDNRIIGNIGSLNATANTFGLELLANDVLPLLRKKMGAEPFSVHLLGAGKPAPHVARAIQAQPEIVIRGFVDDIDAEMQRAKVFLVTNNGSRYQVGHTRYMHAWSLGCCVVGYADAALSIPEIIDGHNALLGSDAEEVAELVAQALRDSSLRRRMGESGYATFRELFKGEAVARGIVKDLLCLWRRKAA
jgi:glycosyltransferase involved in cell wall biosynthesis